MLCTPQSPNPPMMINQPNRIGSKLLVWRAQFVEFVRSTTPRYLWLSTGFLVITISLTIIFTLYVKAVVEVEAQQEFDLTFNKIQGIISDRLEEEAQFLYAGAALFASSEVVTRSDWRIFTEQIRASQPVSGLQGLGFALLIAPEQLDQHIQDIRGQGFPEYQVLPVGQRAVYTSIIYLEPFSGSNLRAFGYDMFSEPVRRAAMERARDENTAVLSGKVTLRQETGQDVQAGVLMYVPVYRHGAPLDTVAQRRAAILGWVFSPERMTNMMNGIISGWDVKEADRQVALQIYDGDGVSANTLLYDSQNGAGPGRASTPALERLAVLDFARHRWTLRVTQFGGLASRVNYNMVWGFFIAGTSISLLAFGLTLSLIRTRVNARGMAERLTAEIRESEKRYRQMFEQNRAVKLLIDPDTGHILKANPAAALFYGYPLEVLQQLSVHDINQLGAAEITGALQHAIIQETNHFIFPHRLASGEVRQVEAYSSPIDLNGRRVLYSIIHDVTERLRAEAALRQSELFNTAILNSVSAEIVVINRDGIIMMTNEPWQRFALENSGGTAQPAAQAWVGINYLEACQAGFGDGAENIRASIQAVLDGRTTGFSLEYPCDTPDKKRWFSMTVTALSNNGISLPQARSGAVIAHTDITDRKLAAMALQVSETRYRRLFETAQDGILILDADTGLVIDVNPFLMKMLGYPKEEFLNKALWELGAFEDKAASKQAYLELQHTGYIRYDDLPLQTQDGRHIAVEFISNVYRVDHIRIAQCNIRDVSASKLAEAALRESEEKYRMVADFTYDLEAWRGPDGRYRYISPACEHISGHTVAEFMADPDLMVKITHPDDQAKVAAHYFLPEAEAQGPTIEFDFRIITPAGETLWINHSCTAVFGDDGRWLGRRESNRDITVRKISEEKAGLLNTILDRLAHIDEMTGINNHRSLVLLAEHEFHVAMRYRPPLSILFFDVDYFKQINDTFGHATGDQTLKQIVQAASAEIRSADVIGRYGGDEFMILLPQTNVEDALSLAERIRVRIAAMRIDTDNGPVSFTVSMGVAQSIHLIPASGVIPQSDVQADTVTNLLKRADQALYAAKQSGRNRCMVYDPDYPSAS